MGRLVRPFFFGECCGPTRAARSSLLSSDHCSRAAAFVDEPTPFDYREIEPFGSADRSMNEMASKRRCTIIGVPMDLGAGRRGVDMGPSAIRIAGLNQAIALLGYDVTDAGNLHVAPPEAVAQVHTRARSIEPGERELLRALGVRVFTMTEIDERGMSTCIEEAIQVATLNTAGIHVTMDMDVVDPFYAPGVGTPERGGVTYREGHLAMEKIANSGRVVSVELTEVNPLYDSANQTAQLAVEMILSALGKKIM